MAKDNSFDIVSETDMQEVENAFNNTEKGLKQRYDLKDSGSKVDFDKGAKTITVLAPSDFVSSQVIDVLNTNLIKRKVDLKAIKWGTPQDASGGMIRPVGAIQQGMSPSASPRTSRPRSSR